LMNRHSTSMSRRTATRRSHNEVIHAKGQIGSQKNSILLTVPVSLTTNPLFSQPHTVLDPPTIPEPQEAPKCSLRRTPAFPPGGAPTAWLARLA
jgi:hypothetical protein